MNLTYTDAPVNPDHLSNCLYMAIKEAKLSHSLMQSREPAARHMANADPLTKKRIRLEKEIVYFEAKLLQLGSVQF